MLSLHDGADHTSVEETTGPPENQKYFVNVDGKQSGPLQLTLQIGNGTPFPVTPKEICEAVLTYRVILRAAFYAPKPDQGGVL